MRTIPLDDQQAHLVVRSLHPFAQEPTAEAVLTSAQRHLLGTDDDLKQLAPANPVALAEAIPNPQVRLHLVQAMVVLALIDSRVSQAQLNWLQTYCRALAVPERVGRYLHQFYHRQWKRLSLDVYWHCFIAEKYRWELRRWGWGWLIRGALIYLGWIQDRALADRYQQLAHLPEDTLGYQFWQFYQQNAYPFPGEKGGLHEHTIFHDATHVLGGYDTSAAGELQTVAMTAGYQRHGDPLASICFILLQQHLGIQAGLLSKAQKGILAEPGMAEKFVLAFKCGLEMRVDLSDYWDHWAAFSQPIAQVRRQYNLVG